MEEQRAQTQSPQVAENKPVALSVPSSHSGVIFDVAEYYAQFKAVEGVEKQTGAKFEAEIETFARWLSLPWQFRKQQTQKEVADIFGVHQVTLGRWKRRAGFKERVRALGAERMLGRTGAILEAIADKAEKEADVSAENFVFGETYGEQPQIAIATQVNVNLSDPFAEEQVKQEELPTWAREGDGE